MKTEKVIKLLNLMCFRIYLSPSLSSHAKCLHYIIYQILMVLGSTKTFRHILQKQFHLVDTGMWQLHSSLPLRQNAHSYCAFQEAQKLGARHAPVGNYNSLWRNTTQRPSKQKWLVRHTKNRTVIISKFNAQSLLPKFYKKCRVGNASMPKYGKLGKQLRNEITNGGEFHSLMWPNNDCKYEGVQICHLR